jgi:hypothetical protein
VVDRLFDGCRYLFFLADVHLQRERFLTFVLDLFRCRQQFVLGR